MSHILIIENDPIVLINPKIISETGKERAEEGCLSIPDIYGDVDRAARVTVRATDLEGNLFEREATELLARAFQHEIDHLHGKLFIDYLSFLKRRAALVKWASMTKDFPQNIRKIPPDEIAGRHGEEAL